MANLYRLLAELNPPSPRLCGEVTQHLPGGACVVELLGGGVIVAKGQDIAVGSRAFIKASPSGGWDLDGPGPSGEFVPVSAG